MFFSRSILWLLFTPLILIAETDSNLLIDTRGVPSSLVDGCVSVISGNFVHQSQDMVLPGSEPLLFERSYSSGDRYNRLICFQWATNHPEELFVHRPKKRGLEVYGGENGGSSLVYHLQEGQLLADAKECHERGLTNIHDRIGGQTNLKNRKAELAKNWREFETTTGSQEKRWFERWTHDKKYGVSRLLVKKVRKANGNWIHYTYKRNRLTGIKIFGRDDRTLLNEVFVRKDSAGMTLYTSDQEEVKYIFSSPKGGEAAGPRFKAKTGRGGWRWKRVLFPRRDLKSVSSRRNGEFTFEMVRLCAELPEKVSRIFHEGQPIVEVSYLKQGGWKDPRYGRVSEIRRPIGPNGEMEVTHTFSYQIEKGAGGSATVSEKDGGQTRYFWDKESHLTRVETADSVEELTWGDKESGNATNLLSRRVSTKDRELLWEKRYTYDDRGNVVKEELEGNIGGEWKVLVQTASFDQFNRVLREIDADGRVTEYKYLGDTTLVTSCVRSVLGKIFERKFVRYSIGGVPVVQISDDGSSRDPNDLTDVHLRKVTETNLGKNGLPVAVRESSIDPMDGKRSVLSLIQNVYDSRGQLLLRRTKGTGDRVIEERWGYDDLGRVVFEQDPLGHQIRYTYNSRGLKVKEQGPRPGIVKKWSYDAAGRCVAEHLFDGVQRLTTRYEYDSRSLKVAEITPANERITYRYDEAKRLIGKTYEGIGEETTHYSPLGAIDSHTTRAGHTTTYTRTVEGLPVEICYPDGTTEEHRYNVDGELIWKRLRTGAQEFYAYDTRGNRVGKSTFADGQLLSSEQWNFTGTLLNEYVSPLGAKTIYSYDVHGRVTKEECGDRVTEYGYDDLGRKVLTRQGERVECLKRDLLGRVVEELVEGGRLIHFIYDAEGNEIAKIRYKNEGEPLITEKCYDLLGRLVEVIDAEGGVVRAIYETNEGRKKIVVAPNGVRTVETLDALKRCIKKQIFSSSGELISSESHIYDPDGNCVESEFQNLANGKPYRVNQKWGAMHQLLEVTEASARTTRQDFNDQGLLSCVVRPDGSCLRYRYDGLGRLRELVSSDETVHYTYTYDPAGNVTKVVDHVHHMKSSRKYNLHSELIDDQQASGLWIRYTYNSFGERASCTLPDGSQILYSYRGGELISIERGGKTHRYDRHLNGEVYSQELMGVAGTLLSETDDVGRIVSQEHPQFIEKNTYDSVGNLLTSNEERFVYNDLSQLVEERTLAHHKHGHTSLHHRLCEDGHQSVHSEFNELLSFKGVELEYNQNGEPIRIGSRELVYDALGRLIEVSDSDNSIHYLYDSFNRGVTEITANGIHAYLYDDQDEIGRFVGDACLELQVIGEGGKAVLFELDGVSFIPLYDVRGNVALLLNDRGDLVSGYRYSAYGECEQSGRDSPWRFKGKRHDPDGMVNFGYRYYLPTLGIWLTPDPSGYADGPNRYAYVHGNPSSHTDLYGLTDIDANFRQNQTYTSHVGIGQYSATDRFIFVNGMLNTQQDAMNSAQTISDRIDGARVYYTYSPTRGFTSDLWGCATWNLRQSVGGVLSKYFDPHRKDVDELKLQIRRFVTEMPEEGQVHLMCHSRGSQVAQQALSEMAREERAQVAVTTFGAAALVDVDGVADTHHYISSRDPIPFMSQSVWWQMAQGQNVHINLSSPLEGLPYDHKFGGKSYQNALQGRLQQMHEQRGWK